jgi:Ca-activated chloride channel family protein
VNDAFLKRLAGLGGGYTELVESEDRLDALMDKVHRRIATPLLTAIKVEPAGFAFEPGTLVPNRLPDLFPGATLTIMGRYKRTVPARSASDGLCVQAKDDAGRPWTATVPATRGEVLAPVWARGHVRDLEDRYATDRGDRAELEQQIVATSLKFGVLCRFTAYVAVDVTEVVNEGGQVKRVTQPVELPAGWELPEREEVLICAVGGGSLRMSRAMAPPKASVRSRSASGTFGKIVDSLFGATDRGNTPGSRPSKKRMKGVPDAETLEGPSSLDLNAYRVRAADMLKRLEAATDRKRELGVLSVKLEELLDDLTSIGASDSDRKPLADLLAELRTFLARLPTADEVIEMGQRCHDVLTTFAAGAAPRSKAKFWA